MPTMDDHESLDMTTWFERMSRLIDALSRGDGAIDRHIRKAYHLHCLAPDEIKRMMPPSIDEARLEAMLECEAYESAISCLLGRAGRVTVKKGHNGNGIEVSLRVDPAAPAPNEVAQTWPSAMLEAWAVSFLSIRPRLH